VFGEPKGVDMSKFKLIQAVLLLCFISIHCRAQETPVAKYVYMIRIPSTVHHGPIIQTGFRLQGRKGIVTALHGVADGSKFSAMNTDGD
jgi:hypothetical protein